jgi:alanyl-tRNA synthetase
MSEFIKEQEWPSTKVRQTFVDYFCQTHNHTDWRSSPVVPVNDPTLLFANAGMNQFKPLFLGTCDPSLEMSKLTRASNSQKCIRAGGKHNDLDDVGKDLYHHTYFEMLGNWSFGDFFKEEAISWAYNLLVNVYKLDSNRLYASYFGGDENVPIDEEARQIWLKFLPPERVLPFGAKENFWEMGNVGPCGPCSEIHYDRIGNRDASDRVNADLPDVIEIWNLVFMQYNRDATGVLKTLPAKHVDTGMGFERLSSILQGKDSNYDTDIFAPIFETITKVTGASPYSGLLGEEDIGRKDMAYRVVADHIRTLVFAITDGAVPSSDGRGYVLRRILRRAVRYGTEILNAPTGFFTTLVDVVIDKYSDYFSELLSKRDFVKFVISDEEQSFVRTLSGGVAHFKKVVASITNSSDKIIPAKEAHFLFSSMGFPLDLTELMAEEHGFKVDSKGFGELMENERKISELAEIARKSGGSKDMSMAAEQTNWLQNNDIPTTDSTSKHIWNKSIDSNILAMFIGCGSVDEGFVNTITPADGLVGLILSESSFYYESGGQIFDTGVIDFKDGSKFFVTNSQTYGGYVLHVGTLSSGSLTVGNTVTCTVDYVRRALVAPNHTMTHVLNYALRFVLIDKCKEDFEGESQGLCEQRGSLVDSERLRFDFSWSGALSSKELAQVEAHVNKKISSKLPVYVEVVPFAAAENIVALRKVFGEKYPDPVRVVSVGVDVQQLINDPANPLWRTNSIEFCGGTHLTNTNEAENFVIIEESGIAKGIRRISALTRTLAKDARKYASELNDRIDILSSMKGSQELSNLNKAIKIEIDTATISIVDKENLRVKLNKISDTIKVWYKAILTERIDNANKIAEKFAHDSNEKGNQIVVTQMDFGSDGKVAKKIQENFRKISKDASFFMATLDEEGEKISCYSLVSKDHISKGFNAKEWCENCISVVGAGKGGGKNDTSQAQIPGNQDILNKVIESAQSFAALKIN